MNTLSSKKSFLQTISSIWLLKNKNWLTYTLKMLLLLAIPYCWILVCGIINENVNAYTFMLYFTFIGAIVLLIFNIFLIACATIIMCKKENISLLWYVLGFIFGIIPFLISLFFKNPKFRKGALTGLVEWIILCAVVGIMIAIFGLIAK